MIFSIQQLKKRLQPRAVLALTLESGRCIGVLVSREKSGENAEKTFVIPMGAEEVCRDAEKAGHELARALAAESIRARRCVVSVPPGWALTASTDLPEVNAEDLQGFLELRAELEFPVSVSELRLSHCPWTLPDGKRRTTLAAIPLKRVEAITKMLAQAGCKPVSISLALDDCLAGGDTALHFLANGSHTEVVITSGGGIASMRSLEGVGGEMEFDPTVFYRDIRITLGRLPEPVRKQVRQAWFRGLPASAEKLLDRMHEPLRQLGIENSATSVEPVPDAVKAAQTCLQGEQVPFDFVTPEVNRVQVLLQRFEDRRQRMISGTVVGAVALALLVFLVRSQMESHYESKWNKMKNRVAELDALQQKIHLYRKWFEPTPQVLQMLDSLIGAFPEQGDVWAKSIQVNDEGKITCTGFARSQAVLLALTDRLRAKPGVTDFQGGQWRGENPIQFSFSFKYAPNE